MIATAETFVEVNDVKRGRQLAVATCRWPGSATPPSRSAWRWWSRLTCNCPESPETVQRDLRELGPDAMLAPPRIWENMLTLMQVKGGDASPLKRRVFEYFRSARRALRAEAQRRQEPVARPTALGLALGEFLVYGPVRDQLGLRNARWCLHRRRAARARHLPLLPLLRRQPEAGLRRHRGVARWSPARPTPRPIPTRSAGRCRGIEVRSTIAARCW